VITHSHQHKTTQGDYTKGESTATNTKQKVITQSSTWDNKRWLHKRWICSHQHKTKNKRWLHIITNMRQMMTTQSSVRD